MALPAERERGEAVETKAWLCPSARRGCVTFGPRQSGPGLWAGTVMGTTPAPKSPERSGLWAEVAGIQVDAGPRNGWEQGQEEGLWLAFWWSLAGPGTGVQGTELGGGQGEVSKKGILELWKVQRASFK